MTTAHSERRYGTPPFKMRRKPTYKVRSRTLCTNCYDPSVVTDLNYDTLLAYLMFVCMVAANVEQDCERICLWPHSSYDIYPLMTHLSKGGCQLGA